MVGNSFNKWGDLPTVRLKVLEHTLILACKKNIKFSFEFGDLSCPCGNFFYGNSTISLSDEDHLSKKYAGFRARASIGIITPLIPVSVLGFAPLQVHLQSAVMQCMQELISNGISEANAAIACSPAR